MAREARLYLTKEGLRKAILEAVVRRFNRLALFDAENAAVILDLIHSLENGRDAEN